MEVTSIILRPEIPQQFNSCRYNDQFEEEYNVQPRSRTKGC